MYSIKPGLIIGFHGCDQSVRDSIVSGELMLKASENDFDWLGKGFYFWENNFERALEFAQYPPGKKKISVPSVLGAVLDLGYCLDLIETRYLQLVKYSYGNFQISARIKGKELPVNGDIFGSADKILRRLDCAVIENLHDLQKMEKLKPFDSVRGVFVEGDELYPGAGFRDKNHIQICVRNPNCIKGFFVPRKILKWGG
jgi:hypothetical protein